METLGLQILIESPQAVHNWLLVVYLIFNNFYLRNDPTRCSTAIGLRRSSPGSTQPPSSPQDELAVISDDRL